MKEHGYSPNTKEKLVNKIASILAYLLSFNSYFNNQIYQSINLRSYLSFDNHKIIFKTGHNRLNWRVKSFYKEEPLMVNWLQTFNDKDIFLDIGANVGIYTLPALIKVKFCYACELDIKNCSVLFENLVLNNFQNRCLILNFGLNSSDSIEEIFYRDNSVGDALQSIGQKQKIPTKMNNPFSINQILFSLDGIFEKFGLIKPNKIKIDVDGNEKRVFEGGKKTILSADEIYYEFNDYEDDQYILNEILKTHYVLKEEKISRPIGDKDIKNILFKKKLI